VIVIPEHGGNCFAMPLVYPFKAAQAAPLIFIISSDFLTTHLPTIYQPSTNHLPTHTGASGH
jgi:hypothetical protein